MIFDKRPSFQSIVTIELNSKFVQLTVKIFDNLVFVVFAEGVEPALGNLFLISLDSRTGQRHLQIDCLLGASVDDVQSHFVCRRLYSSLADTLGEKKLLLSFSRFGKTENEIREMEQIMAMDPNISFCFRYPLAVKGSIESTKSTIAPFISSSAAFK
ncbi:hypothetical protein ACOME3_007368 [Neoechinorhynchus agilis]